jgi:hypothetical protein
LRQSGQKAAEAVFRIACEIFCQMSDSQSQCMLYKRGGKTSGKTDYIQTALYSWVTENDVWKEVYTE